MGTLHISAGDLHFTGRWVDGCDRTIVAVREMLPLRSRLIHVRWIGEGCCVPLGDLRLDIPPEEEAGRAQCEAVTCRQCR